MGVLDVVYGLHSNRGYEKCRQRGCTVRYGTPRKGLGQDKSQDISILNSCIELGIFAERGVLPAAQVDLPLAIVVKTSWSEPS